MRDLLDEVPPGDLEPAFATLLNLLQRGKHLEPYRVLGNRYLVPIGGSEYFSSQHIHCPGCLTQKKNSCVRYHHNIVQAVIVNPDMKQVLPLPRRGLPTATEPKNKIVKSMPPKGFW